jgi:hypothetical protein
MSFNAKNLMEENERVAGMVPDIMEAWTSTFRNKNSNYGNSWLLTGQTISLWFPQGVNLDTVRKQIVHGLLTRMLDKIIRFAHLELLGEADKVGEKSSETVGDLGVYGFMASAITNPKGPSDQTSEE